MLKDTFDRTAWSGDIRAVFDQLRLEDVTLVAWSYSGLVLADYLAVHGEHRIRALGLVAAATRAGFAEAYLDYGSGALPEGLLSDDPVRSAGADGVFVAESAGRHPFTSGDAKELVGIVSGTPREVLRRLLSRNVDNADLWARTAVPVLLSHGTHDRINLPVISQRQASTIPGSRSSVYADAGHLPFWEQPARFNTELLDLVHNPASVRAQRPPSVSSA
jgi:pimeloyl-ACP methyl ester carboxylesterase